MAGSLPIFDFLTNQVSWLIGSVLISDHPPALSIFGENALSLIVVALMADPLLWAKTF